MIAEYVQQISIWAIPILAAIVFHEVAHGWVAFRLGDPTAARMGRLTLNPISHIDLFGTVILPLLLVITGAPFLFGY
ncbi:MAG: site-2 protease family protein, partial [Candidatus Binatia bacterium]